MGNVLITGGTGVIGRYLSNLLLQKGFQVSLLSRSGLNQPNLKTYRWSIDQGIVEAQALEHTDHIIHLAGANIADKRWSKTRKQQIIDSRVKSADLLFKYLQAQDTLPKSFISASAVGYYGAVTSDTIYTEDHPVGQDFLATCCQLWEDAADQFKTLNIRTVKLRTGVVLSPEGIVSKLKILSKLGLTSAIGSGKQYMPWIHISDLCNIYLKAITDVNMQGTYNSIAPAHISNQTFMTALAEAHGRKLWLPNVPKLIIYARFGEMAKLLVEGSRISCQKLTDTGFEFQYPQLEAALEQIVKA